MERVIEHTEISIAGPPPVCLADIHGEGISIDTIRSGVPECNNCRLNGMEFLIERHTMASNNCDTTTLVYLS